MSDNSTSKASGNLIIGKRFSHHHLRRFHRNPRIRFITSAGEAHLRTKPIDLHPVPIAPVGHVPQSEREHHICTLPWLENSCSLESLQNRCRIPRLRWELGIELWDCRCSCRAAVGDCNLDANHSIAPVTRSSLWCAESEIGEGQTITKIVGHDHAAPIAGRHSLRIVAWTPFTRTTR